MNSSISQEVSLLRELLTQQSEVGIVVGTHQNLDTYAAALALFASLKAAGKKVQIISKKAPTVEVSNLVGINKVGESFSSAGGNNSKLVISLPYIKGEVEKVLFTEFPNPENPTNINFHLTAAPGKSITPFSLSDVKLIWDGGAGAVPSLIITVGVGTIDELNGLETNSVKIVNIDNFSGNTQFGDVVLVDQQFSSLSEISGKVIKDLNLPLDLDTAQNLLDGVLFATRNFTKQNTSPFAFETVSAAMYAGARRNEDANNGQNMGGSHQGQQRHQNQPDRPRDQRGQGRSQQARTRVGENDFPAMHMNRDRTGQSTMGGAQNQPDRRFSDAQRGGQAQGLRQDRPQRAQQPSSGAQFGQNPNDIDELMRKINEESRSRQSQRFEQNRQRPSFPQENTDEHQDEAIDERFSAQDAQVIDEPVNRNESMPEDNYTPPDPSEVPDDWLMPKVFKSSKNNN